MLELGCQLLPGRVPSRPVAQAMQEVYERAEQMRGSAVSMTFLQCQSCLVELAANIMNLAENAVCVRLLRIDFARFCSECCGFIECAAFEMRVRECAQRCGVRGLHAHDFLQMHDRFTVAAEGCIDCGEATAR